MEEIFKTTTVYSRNVETQEVKVIDIIIESVSNAPEIKNDMPIVRLLDSKLEFNDAAIEAIGLIPGESHIDVRYFETTGIPGLVINGSSGKKLYKNKTISFRGLQNKELRKCGETFSIIEYPGYWRLVHPDEVQDWIPSGTPTNEAIKEDAEIEEQTSDIEDLVDKTKEVLPPEPIQDIPQDSNDEADFDDLFEDLESVDNEVDNYSTEYDESIFKF